MGKATTSLFRDDMPAHYGDWGVDSEIGKLRAVLMHRPGKEIDNITDPAAASMVFSKVSTYIPVVRFWT